MKYEKELSFIKYRVRKAFELYGAFTQEDIHQKSAFDIVTETDFNIEKYLMNGIASEFSGDHILSEEYNSDNGIIERTWIIDPIDGTCNFKQNIPLFGIQCALVENNEVVLSYMYLPVYNEEYHAIIGEGAWKNGTKINISDNTLNNALVSFGDYPHTSAEKSQRQHKAIGFLSDKIAKIRMFGSACIDFVYVAEGRTDGCVVITRNLWDILPGMFLCKEAGAVLTNLEGEPYKFYDEGVIVSANKTLQDLIVEAFN